MKKKIFCSFTSLILVVVLTACGDASATTVSSSSTSTVETQPAQHVHDWKDATCTEPRTCTSCGETEGEALGHDWADATCTEPKTCTRCGATEGEALGHDWAEATLTEPKTCTKCGATEGEPLSAADIAAAVIEDEKYFEDGAFCPKLYAEELGFKWYGEYDDEMDISIIINGIEYFVYYIGGDQSVSVAYTDNERCYRITIADFDVDKRGEAVKLKTGNKIADDSSAYTTATAEVLVRLANGDTEIKTWQFGELPKCYTQFDDSPKYFDDGFIDSTKFAHQNEAESDPPIKVKR
ncbi:hypothetical protein IKD60_00460 [Candidatus Saccharibacteria bacterium]|nr:hypothetical protein [Candidatus Saccharibacteria bacterium]